MRFGDAWSTKYTRILRDLMLGDTNEWTMAAQRRESSSSHYGGFLVGRERERWEWVRSDLHFRFGASFKPFSSRQENGDFPLPLLSSFR